MIYLVGSINCGQDLCVALFQISTTIGLTEHAQLTLDPAQLTSTSTVQPEALIGDEVLSGHVYVSI